jgi:hypothetical protein
MGLAELPSKNHLNPFNPVKTQPVPLPSIPLFRHSSGMLDEVFMQRALELARRAAAAEA